MKFIAKDNAVSALYPIHPAGVPDVTIAVAAPVISCTDNVVTITCATEGATIRYSTDGTSYASYTAPIAITETTTFYAKASKADMTDSQITVKECEYVAQVETPVIDCTDNVVTITCATDGATISYSTDGTTYAAYTAPITITETTTFYAKASKAGMRDSEVATKVCEYVAPVVEG